MSRIDPVLSYNFSVTLLDSSSLLTTGLSAIQLAAAGGFSECSGLETTLDVEEYKEGGNNGTILLFATRVAPARLHLKRGVTLSQDLWQWHYDFAKGLGRRRDGVITLQDDLRNPVMIWTFSRGLPVKWTGPAFNAATNQVAIEELEIAHEGLQLMPAAAI